MSLYKRAKLFLKFQRHKRLSNPAPLVAILNITSRCNMNCAYCFAEHRGEFPDLTVVQWKGIVDDLRSRGAGMISLQGGEPLLYDGFHELIRHIKGKGMICQLVTNGVLAPKHIRELAEADLVMVSLDGDEEGHNLNRGQWGAVMKGIEAIAATNIPLRLNCVLTKNNLNDIEWLLNLGDSLNCYVGFTIPAKCSGVDAFKDRVLSAEEIKSAHTRLLELRRRGKKITCCEKALEHVANYPKPYDELIYKTEPNHREICEHQCAYGRYIIFVGADGRVYPCTTLWELPEIFKAKNIFTDSMGEALKNAQILPCWTCYVAGGVEWEEMSSFRGLRDALEFTFNQRRKR